MNIEERLRNAFHAAGPDDPAPAEAAWDGIQARIRRRGRLRHKLRWAVWLAPVVALAVGVPVVESLAPAGQSSHVVTVAPTPTPGAGATASAPALRSPAAAPVTSLSVLSCPIVSGVAGTTPPPLPTTVTATGLPAGAAVGAYAGPMTLLGPAGWHCEGGVAANGSQTLVIVPPGAAPPLSASGHTTQAVQAVEGYFPSPGTGNVFGVGCPFFPASRAEAAAQQYPVCDAAPSGEAVTLLRPTAARFRDPPGVAGDGFMSGGPNPAEGAAFSSGSGSTAAVGMVTCTLPVGGQALCRAIVDDFIARYAP